jgi:SAM-dependent methyltransferase
MSEHRYIAAGEKDEMELNRLRLLERIFDPSTTRHLEMIGVADGWGCLEVGAGAGSVARWLSTRVGPTGKIVATDIDTKFLRRLSIPNLEVRQHDITKDSLEIGQYDLVFCRTLLMQLLEPEEALKRMAGAVRPSGMLLVEEFDYGSILSADVTNPSAVIFSTTRRALIDFLREKRIINLAFGRQVRHLVEQLGFTDVVQEGCTFMCRGGDPMAKFDTMSFQMAARPMIATGLLREEQHEQVQRLNLDPTFNYPGPTMFSAWGKKPG